MESKSGKVIYNLHPIRCVNNGARLSFIENYPRVLAVKERRMYVRIYDITKQHVLLLKLYVTVSITVIEICYNYI